MSFNEAQYARARTYPAYKLVVYANATRTRIRHVLQEITSGKVIESFTDPAEAQHYLYHLNRGIKLTDQPTN